MTSPLHPLDEILDNIDERAIGQVNRPIEEHYRAEAKAAILAWIETEIIGGNEDTYYLDPVGDRYTKNDIENIEIRNHLRAEQRNKLRGIK